jgi:hypothetical protein
MAKCESTDLREVMYENSFVRYKLSTCQWRIFLNNMHSKGKSQ